MVDSMKDVIANILGRFLYDTVREIIKNHPDSTNVLAAVKSDVFDAHNWTAVMDIYEEVGAEDAEKQRKFLEELMRYAKVVQ